MLTSAIISAGLLKAGNTNLSANALIWLNAWLRAQYRSWPWPFLRVRKTGYALGTGVDSLLFGSGSGSVTEEVQFIEDPIYVYTSDRRNRGVARILNIQRSVAADVDEDGRDTTQGRGIPNSFKVRASGTWGKWELIPFPVPDQSYLLSFDYLVQPADVATTDTPIYPNTRTMIQAVVVDALQYMKDRDGYAQELEMLASMVREDRARYGQVPGTNDQIILDAGTFR
jgi:hypothetical protein